jgi:hypothetical protein
LVATRPMVASATTRTLLRLPRRTLSAPWPDSAGPPRPHRPRSHRHPLPSSLRPRWQVDCPAYQAPATTRPRQQRLARWALAAPRTRFDS